jgi:hypothetical protein
MGPELYGVKWRNFKLAFVAQQYSTDPVGKLSSPRIINMVADPQEREPLDLPHMHSWTVTHFNRLLGEFQASIEREPPVPKTPRSISSHRKHSNVHSSPDLADTHIRPFCVSRSWRLAGEPGHARSARPHQLTSSTSLPRT